MSIGKILKSIDDAVHKRIGRISIVFEVMNDFGFDCQAPIILELLKMPAIRLAITTSGLGDEDLCKDYILDNGFKRNFISRSKAAIGKWDLVVCTDSCGIWYRRNHKKAYLQHGITGVGNYPYNNPDRLDFRNAGYDYLLATSDHVSDRAQHYYRGLGDCIFKTVVGYPKLDAAINSDLNRDEVLKRFGFSPDKMTLLFATHWSRYSLIKTFGMDLLKALIEQNAYNIIVSGHKYLWDTEEDWFTQNINWRKRLEQFEAHDNLLIADNISYSELMIASDILLSDHNSLVVEFSAMNKPILFYGESFTEIHDKTLCQLVRNAGSVFCSIQTAIDLLKSIREESGLKNRQLSQARIDLAEYCFTNIGTARFVAAKIVVEICRKERAR